METECEDADEREEFAKDALQQVKIFLQIMFGSVVRFYSTVLDWDYIQSMREDLIERLTSKIFNNKDFSYIILQLCRETIKDKEKKYGEAVFKLKHIKPKDCGISPYFTLDETSKLEQVYRDLHPDENFGDSGSSSGEGKSGSNGISMQVDNHATGQSAFMLRRITENPDES